MKQRLEGRHVPVVAFFRDQRFQRSCHRPRLVHHGEQFGQFRHHHVVVVEGNRRTKQRCRQPVRVKVRWVRAYTLPKRFHRYDDIFIRLMLNNRFKRKFDRSKIFTVPPGNNGRQGCQPLKAQKLNGGICGMLGHLPSYQMHPTFVDITIFLTIVVRHQLRR